MIWIAAFIALTAALAAVAWWRGDCERAAAFGTVLLGLVVMAALRGDAHGIVAFAVWTVVSYLILRFPVASALYLLSAFCYILWLQGAWDYALQVVSNVSGLAGLAAVQYGKPRFNRVSRHWPRAWGRLALGGNGHIRDSVNSCREEKRKPE